MIKILKRREQTVVTDDIAYAEVFETLSYMNKYAVMKIPVEILQYIKDNRNTKYISDIDPNNIFDVNNISNKARSILAWLDLNYLSSGKNKEKKLKMYRENEEKYQMKLRKQYNPDEVIKNKTTEVNISQSNNIPMEVKKQGIFAKIVEFIKKLFIR